MTKPTLRLRKEFEKVLQNYSPSQEALKLVRSRPLVLLLGISGGGRNTIINHLVNDGKYQFIVSDTTRSPKLRDGKLEQHGHHYNFRSEEDFLNELHDGKFLEAEIVHGQQVSGIGVHELTRAFESGKVPINEVDIGGVEVIKRIKHDVKLYFIVPPTYKEWIFRLRGREIMSEAEERDRLVTARKILEAALKNDNYTFIANTSSHKTSERLDGYIHGIDPSAEDQQTREIANSILMELSSGTH